MDWFHCNQCYRKDGAHFFVTSCGHIFCKNVSLWLKPQEKMFFRSPVETALQYFSHISQVWNFQKKQTDLLIAFYKHRLTKLEAAMQEAQQTIASQNKELSVLRKENGELKKFLAILKVNHTSTSGHHFPITVSYSRPISQHSSQVVSRSSSVESIPYRVAGFGRLGPQGGRGLQERSTPRDSYTETPSPASTHSLSYRPSSASSGQGIFPFIPSLSGGELDRTRVLTPINSGQREIRTPLGSLPVSQLSVLQTVYQQQRQMGLARGREAWSTSR